MRVPIQRVLHARLRFCLRKREDDIQLRPKRLHEVSNTSVHIAISGYPSHREKILTEGLRVVHVTHIENIDADLTAATAKESRPAKLVSCIKEVT